MGDPENNGPENDGQTAGDDNDGPGKWRSKLQLWL